MPYKEVQRRLKENGVIILDGAMGTELQRRGVPMNSVARSAEALQAHPETVRLIHEDYVQVGADVITTNTFATARHVLAPAGSGERTGELNFIAVRLAQEARDRTAAGRSVAIAGSMSTFMPRADRSNPPPRDEVQASYQEQAGLLAHAGVDLLLLEMPQDAEQSRDALAAAVATGLPVWAGFSCSVGKDGTVNLLDGTPFTSALADFDLTGVSALCVMHTEVNETLPALQVLRRRWPGPIGAYPHSGGWQMPHWQFENVISREELVTEAERWVQTGVQIVGTCCGMGPDYIQLLSERLPGHIPTPRAP